MSRLLRHFDDRKVFRVLKVCLVSHLKTNPSSLAISRRLFDQVKKPRRESHVIRGFFGPFGQNETDEKVLSTGCHIEHGTFLLY